MSAAGTGAAAAAAAVVVAVDDAAAVGLVLRDGVPAPALVAAVAAVLEAVEPVGLWGVAVLAATPGEIKG